MHKKLMLACMAIAAFAAFVIAPAASASPVATDPVGTSLATGASITGLSSGSTTFTASVPVTCSSAHIPGTLTLNNGKQIKGEVAKEAAKFTGTGTNGDCTSSLGSVGVTVNSKLCFETVIGTDNVIVTGCTEEVTFTLSVTGTVNCKYRGNVTSGATFKTNADATVNVVEGKKGTEGIPLVEGSEFLCPHSGTLDMHFNLTTTGGGTILVS